RMRTLNLPTRSLVWIRDRRVSGGCPTSSNRNWRPCRFLIGGCCGCGPPPRRGSGPITTQPRKPCTSRHRRSGSAPPPRGNPIRPCARPLHADTPTQPLSVRRRNVRLFPLLYHQATHSRLFPGSPRSATLIRRIRPHSRQGLNPRRTPRPAAQPRVAATCFPTVHQEVPLCLIESC